MELFCCANERVKGGLKAVPVVDESLLLDQSDKVRNVVENGPVKERRRLVSGTRLHRTNTGTGVEEDPDAIMSSLGGRESHEVRSPRLPGFQSEAVQHSSRTGAPGNARYSGGLLASESGGLYTVEGVGPIDDTAYKKGRETGVEALACWLPPPVCAQLPCACAACRRVVSKPQRIPRRHEACLLCPCPDSQLPSSR